MKTEIFYSQQNKKERSAQIEKKVGNFLFAIMQIPVCTELLLGDTLHIVLAIVCEIILIIGIVLIHCKKTRIAAAIVSTYFYFLCPLVPYIYNNLYKNVPAIISIIAIFITNTYISNNKLYQRYNLVVALIALSIYFSALTIFYGKNPQYITDITICAIGFIIIFSVIYYFRKDVNKYQKELERNINFLKQITDTNPHFIYTTDTQNNFTFVNETMGNFDKENSVELIGKNISTFWNSLETIDQLDTHSEKNHHVKIKSFTNQANETRFHEVFETPLLDSNNETVGHLGVSIDVTEKRVAQIKLKKSENRYKELFENNQLGIATSKNARFHEVNNTFCNMTGYTQSEIIGCKISKIMHPEDYLATLPLSKEVINDEVSGHSFEHRFIRKDKSIGFAIVHMHKSSFKYSDNTIRTVATLTDISKLKAAKAALKESEAIYRTLVNNAFDGIEIHESIPPKNDIQKWQHKLIERNNKVYDILKSTTYDFKKESFSFKDILDISPTHQRSGVKSTEFIKSLTPKFQKNNVLTFEWQYGNQANFIDTEMTIIRFKINNRQYLTTIYKDISERKSAELKLKKSLRKIERKNKKIKKALDSNDALEKFAFSVAHELKDPLISIQGFASFLKKSFEHQHSENNLRDINAIIDSSQRMHNVITKFLLFARLDTQKIMIEEVNLNNLIAHLQQELHTLITSNKAILHLKNIPNSIYVDETLFHQLFQNLISNAIKYSSPQRLPKITIEAIENDQFWNFTIQDNGIGIAPNFHKSIFNFFKRVDASSNKGTGIGLALCEKIVKNHGGKISLTSEVDKGSIFKFSISKAISLSQAKSS